MTKRNSYRIKYLNVVAFSRMTPKKIISTPVQYRTVIKLPIQEVEDKVH